MAEILRWGEVERSLTAIKAALDDPKTVEPFAKHLRDKARAWVDSQGGGTWEPFAASTLAHMKSQGSSNITKHGKIRASKLRRLDAQLKSIVNRTGRGGWSDADRKKVAALQRRLALLRKQQARPETLRGAAGQAWGKADELRAQIQEAQEDQNDRRVARLSKKLVATEGRALLASHRADVAGDYKSRSIGKRKIETHKMMPRMASTIRVKVRRRTAGGLLVHVYSRAGDVGYFHDVGEGKNKKRTIIPEPDAADLDMLADLLEGVFVEAFE